VLTRFTRSAVIDPANERSPEGEAAATGEGFVMGMKARLATGAVVAIAVIGTVSATAGSGDRDRGSGDGDKAGSSPSAGHKPGGGKDAGGGSHDPDATKAPGKETAFGGDGDSRVGTEPKGMPATSMDGDGGMFKVGADIAPGTYRSTGNAGGSCHWERVKDAGNGPGSITARDHVTGTAVVTISASDAYFKTNDCGDWKKA
jgi:hypothetical protein